MSIKLIDQRSVDRKLIDYDIIIKSTIRSLILNIV